MSSEYKEETRWNYIYDEVTLTDGAKVRVYRLTKPGLDMLERSASKGLVQEVIDKQTAILSFIEPMVLAKMEGEILAYLADGKNRTWTSVRVNCPTAQKNWMVFYDQFSKALNALRDRGRVVEKRGCWRLKSQ